MASKEGEPQLSPRPGGVHGARDQGVDRWDEAQAISCAGHGCSGC